MGKESTIPRLTPFERNGQPRKLQGSSVKTCTKASLDKEIRELQLNATQKAKACSLAEQVQKRLTARQSVIEKETLQQRISSFK